MNELHTNYLSNFLDHLSVLGYQSRPSYKKGVEELLKRIELQGKLVHQIMASDLQAHHAYLLQRPNRRTGGALSIYTVRNYWYSLQLFFAYLEKMGWLSSNPMSGLKYSFPVESKTILWLRIKTHRRSEFRNTRYRL